MSGSSWVRYVARPWTANAASLSAFFIVGLMAATTAASMPTPAMSPK